VGTRPDVIRSAVERLLDDKRAYRRFTSGGNPFGDGKASRRIVRHLTRVLRQA
jgi:UDP-N-acetylglucosamine 2-epimerase (non-hydrolysing)